MFRISIYLIICNLLFFSKTTSSKNVLDVISNNQDLTTFNLYLEKTGLDRVLEKKLPWNWTIFAPSNKAFNEAPEMLKDEILNDEFLSKNIFMDHIMTGHKTSLDIDEKATTQITVSNKPLQIYKSRNLFVKDMVVVQENLIGNNGVVHVIDCIMYVQPSSEDERLTKEIMENYPITSCCMQSEAEINSFKKATKNRFWQTNCIRMTFYSSNLGIKSTKLQGFVVESNWNFMISSQASLHALGDPGKAKIKVLLINPAIARDWREEVPIFLKLMFLNISPNPGISLVIISFKTSGVESLPVNPVPPDEIITCVHFSLRILSILAQNIQAS